MRFYRSMFRSLMIILSILAITPGLGFSEQSTDSKTKPETATSEIKFSATLLEAEGVVLVINKATNTATAAAEGLKVFPGDLIQTQADSAVDILYEDGNVTSIDENTTIEIKALSLEKDQMISIVELTKGRIRNSVAKVMNSRIKFEVHTRSGVAGITGTPPWFVSIVPGAEMAEIDLLTKKGDAGGLSFIGTDKNATRVNLTPGTRTTATRGSPPAPPKKIEPARLKMLEKAVQVRVKPEVREKKRTLYTEKIAAIISTIKANEKRERAKPQEKPKPKVEPKAEQKAEPKSKPTPIAEKKQKTDPAPAEKVKTKPVAEEKQKEKAVKKKTKKKKSKKKKKKRAKKKSDDDMQDMFKRSRRKIDDKFK